MYKAYIIKQWGVLYKNAYRQFILQHSIALSNYLRKAKPDDYETGFPRFFDELARKSDMGIITDDQFYDTLVAGTGVPRCQISALMNEVGPMLNGELLDYLRNVKKQHPTVKFALIADADKGFLQQFMYFVYKGEAVESLFSAIICSSERREALPDYAFFTECSERLGIVLTDMQYMDDSVDAVKVVRSYGIAAIPYLPSQDLAKLIPT